jgi:hypothetical protein
LFIAYTVNVPKLDREGRCAEPGIFPEPNFRTISNHPPIAKLNRVHCPQKPFEKIRSFDLLARKNVWVVGGILGVTTVYQSSSLLETYLFSQDARRQMFTSLRQGMPNPP